MLAPLQNQIFTKFEMEHIGHRIRIGDDRNGAIGKLTIQKQPRIRLLLASAGKRVPKHEAIAADRVSSWDDDFGVPRLVKVETTGNISRPHAAALNRQAGTRSGN